MSIVMKVALILLGFIPMLIAKRIAKLYYHPIPIVRSSDIMRQTPHYRYKTSTPIVAMIFEVLIGMIFFVLGDGIWIILFISSMISALYLLIIELIIEHEFRPALMFDSYAVFSVLYLLNII